MLGAILFAMVDAAADAPPKPVPVTTITVAPPKPMPAGPVTSPASVGKPHTCPEYQYPVSAMQAGTEGSTTLQFSITPQGTVADISVRNSSGNGDLDTAAVTCARDWLYNPAMENGVPIQVLWRALVRWQIRPMEPYSAVPDAVRDCLKADPTGWSEVKAAPLRSVVRAHFAGGVMSDITLAGSSGDGDLDNRTVACYRSVSTDATAEIPDGDELFVIMKPGE